MSTVVVERRFGEPAVFARLQAIEDRSAWCLEAHHVRFLRSYFSRDRRRMVCLYEAPDAESVRHAQETAGLPFERAWAARVLRHPGEEPDGDAVLVERTLPSPVDELTLRETAARGAWCREQWGCRIVWSFLSGDGRRAVCVFAGPDTESVRQTQKQVQLPVDAAWPATVHESPAGTVIR